MTVFTLFPKETCCDRFIVVVVVTSFFTFFTLVFALSTKCHIFVCVWHFLTCMFAVATQFSYVVKADSEYKYIRLRGRPYIHT